MLLRFRRHNTADQGSDEASERPRRGIDTGNHYEFFGGTVTIGAWPSNFLTCYSAGTADCLRDYIRRALASIENRPHVHMYSYGPRSRRR